MNFFTPNDFIEERDYRAAPGLERDWIRSARFLTVSTLALLVDTDSKNQTAREAALGGFLGVGELFARADKFDMFARHLNDGYGGEEGLAATKKELVRRKEELARLRNKVADTGDKSPELNEPMLSEFSKALLDLYEKMGNRLATPLHSDSPEKRLAELKVRSVLDSMALQIQVHSLEEEIRTIEEKVRKIDRKRDQALEAARLFRKKANQYCADRLERLFDVAFPMFTRVQANEVFDLLQRGPYGKSVRLGCKILIL